MRTIPLLLGRTASVITFIRNENKERPVNSKTAPIEWRTAALVVATYAAWWLVIANFDAAPLLLTPVLLYVLTFHTSLVHELIHGHPTKFTWLNDLMGTPPIALIYPYAVFKETHLKHHFNEDLTLPGVDPESFYFHPDDWQRKTVFHRALAWVNMTLAGRLLLNPMFSVIDMVKLCLTHLSAGSIRQKLIWVIHIPAIAGVLYIATVYYAVPLWIYLLCAYIAHSVISLRSFFEHRAVGEPEQRIVIVDACGFFKFLFLNNNFHSTHHRYPHLPWYEVENRFRAERDTELQKNGNFYFSGYRDWLQFLFRPVNSPIHPLSFARSVAHESR